MCIREEREIYFKMFRDLTDRDELEMVTALDVQWTDG